MNILIVFLISLSAQQQIDMLAIEDTLYIAMGDYSSPKVFKYESTFLVQEIDLGGFYNNLSIGYSREGADPILLIGCSLNYDGNEDSLFALAPSDLSQIWKTGDFPYHFEPWFRKIFVERWHPETRHPRFISYYCTDVMKSSDEQWIFSNTFDPNTYPIIWGELLYYFNTGGYIGDHFMGSVTVSEEPMITGLVNNHGSPVPYYPNWWTAQIHVHEVDTDSIMRVIPVGGGEYLDPLFYPRGYSLGSCSGHAVLLWSDTTGTIYSTEVAGSPLEIVSTEPFGFSLPTDYSAIAASRNPSDSGILLCYYRDGYIRARYMEDSWFSYEHQVAPTTSIYSGNLAVSGTPDGYWIAWNDGSAYPNIAWIGRETLTGISENQSNPIGNLCLTTAPNPFCGTLEVTMNSYEIPVQINIYDTSGHQVHSGTTDASGHFTWDAHNMPAGVYLIRAIHDAEFVDSKTLLIR